MKLSETQLRKIVQEEIATMNRVRAQVLVPPSQADEAERVLRKNNILFYDSYPTARGVHQALVFMSRQKARRAVKALRAAGIESEY